MSAVAIGVFGAMVVLALSPGNSVAPEESAEAGTRSTPPCAEVVTKIRDRVSAGWRPAIVLFGGDSAIVISDGVTDGFAYEVSDVSPLDVRLRAADRGYVWLEPPSTGEEKPPKGRFLVLLRATSRATRPQPWDVYQYDAEAMWRVDFDQAVRCSGGVVDSAAVRQLTESPP